MTQKGHRVIKGRRDLRYGPKRPVTFVVGWPTLWPQKVKGSLEVTVTYFMTPKVTVTFVVDLTLSMIPKAHGVI